MVVGVHRNQYTMENLNLDIHSMYVIKFIPRCAIFAINQYLIDKESFFTTALRNINITS